MADSFHPNTSSTEYLFAKIVDTYNRNVYQGEEGFEDKELITASTGRELHKVFLNKIAERYGNKDTSGLSFRLATRFASEAFAEVTGSPLYTPATTIEELDEAVRSNTANRLPVTAEENAYNEASETYRKEWMKRMKFPGMSRGQTVVELSESQAWSQLSVPETAYIPISPFDEQFADRTAMVNVGTEILYAPANRVITNIGREVGEDGKSHRTYSADTHVADVPLYRYDEENDRMVQTRETLYSDDDRYGIARLKPYLTKNEYEDAKTWLNLDGTNVGEAGKMRPEAFDKSIAILRYLQDNGIAYNVKRDMKKGQLKACISGTKMEIRITESRGNERYIGRVYNDGYSIYMTSSKMTGRSRNGRPGSVYAQSLKEHGIDVDSMSDEKWKEWAGVLADKDNNGFGIYDYSEVSMDEMMAVIKYALGGTVDRKQFHDARGNAIGNNNGRSYSGSSIGTVSSNGSSVDTYLIEDAAGPHFETYMGYTTPKTASNGGKPVVIEELTGPDGEKLKDVEIQYSLSIRSMNNHSNAYIIFEDEDKAKEYLQEAIDSAKGAFVAGIDLDGLIEEVNEHADDPDYVPNLGSDPALSSLRQIYWDTLTGKATLERLVNEDGTKNDGAIRKTIEGISEENGLEQDIDESEIMDIPDEDEAVSGEFYEGTPEEMVRQHLADSVDMLFGSYDADDQGKRFNPAMVSMYMVSGTGIYRNNDNIVSAATKLGWSGDEFLGDDFQTGIIKDKMLRFDEASAKPIRDNSHDETVDLVNEDDNFESPFMHSVFDAVKQAVLETGCYINDDDIRIDENGVIQYKAQQVIATSNNKYDRKSVRQEVIGYVGQIFAPDEDGVVTTKYAGSENKLFTPGYNAHIIPVSEENYGQNFVQRTRLTGLEQTLCRDIAMSIRYDLIGAGEAITDENGKTIGRTIGSTTNVNNAYRGLYKTTYKVNVQQQEGESLKDAYIRECHMTGLPDEIIKAKFRTFKNVFHYGKDIIEGSTVNAEHRAEKLLGNNDADMYSLTNDNVVDPYQLTGRKNVAITTECSATKSKSGKQVMFYSDSELTGSGKNQGATRYGVDSIVVNREGCIVPKVSMASKSNIDDDAKLHSMKSNRAALMSVSPMKYVDYIPADRVQMVGSNLKDASGVAGMEEHTTSKGDTVKGVGIAMMTLQGLTFDDGAVISKDFAEKYGIITEEGETRPLKAGDKICDFAGNKSIVACVVDRNMSPEEAEAKHLEQAVKLFNANPDLDIVQAPYSAVSRFNAATAKFLMENPMDLNIVKPDGSIEVHEGCMGFGPVIITDKSVDEKTKQYDEDEVRAGGGRRFSCQLGWAMAAQNAPAILDECFKNNQGALTDYREYLLTLGYDMDETGHIHRGYYPHNGEERNYFMLPDVNTEEFAAVAASKDSNTEKIEARKAIRQLAKQFGDEVGGKGGFLQLPFPIKMKSGETLETTTADGQNMYFIPVMSSRLRSGQTFQDGSVSVHDYTNEYIRIFESAVEYNRQKAKLDANKNLSKSSRETIERAMESAKNDATTSFNTISESIVSRKFNTKYNAIRENFMAKRLPHSATAVWTPDSSLALDEVAMSSKMAKTLGVEVDSKTGDNYVMTWRDPILRTYGVRYMKVQINDDLTGVAVNPLVAVAFDGDFDGDSIGLWKPSTEAAKQEAMDKFSLEATMLDFTQKRENGDYKLIFNTGMDVVSKEVEDENRELTDAEKEFGRFENLKDQRLRLEHEVNEVYRATLIPEGKEGHLSHEEAMAKNTQLLSQISGWAKDCLCDTCGTEIISFNSPSEHVQSIMNIVNHGAKGSESKVKNYLTYAGFEYDCDNDDHIIIDSVVDTGKPGATVRDVKDVEQATAIKSFGTGIAGSISQRLVVALRNTPNPDVFAAALQETYLSTQGILQAKHDPVQAQKLYDAVSEPIRWIWRGYDIERSEKTGNYYIKKNKDGSPIMATKNDWLKNFKMVHEGDLGLGDSINYDQVNMVADALCGKNGKMLDIENVEVLQRDLHASPLDILAYRPSEALSYIDSIADKDVCLFGNLSKDGHGNFVADSCNYHYAPSTLKYNMREAVNNAEWSQFPEAQREYKMIAAPDTQRSYTHRAKIRIDEDIAKSVHKVKAAEEPQTPAPEQSAPADKAGTFDVSKNVEHSESKAAPKKESAKPTPKEIPFGGKYDGIDTQASDDGKSSPADD